MARQVVSYVDLDTPTFSQAQIGDSITSEATNQPVNENSILDSSPVKKRKRNEATGSGAVILNNNDGSYNMRNGGEVIRNTSSLTLSPSFPPKPPVRKRGKSRRRSNGGEGNRMFGAPSENSSQSKSNVAGAMQHWDDPGAQADGIPYDEEVDGAIGVENNRAEGDWENAVHGDSVLDADENEDDNDEGDEGEDESRELTHEEIWDDSSLIAAWDAANEEYEAMHGKSKRWKKERVHKSPLSWYNVPPEKPTSSTKKGKNKKKRGENNVTSAAEGRPHGASEQSMDGESKPLNYETYVPTHDASLAFSGLPNRPAVSEPFASQQGSGDGPAIVSAPPFGAAVPSADQAFSRALDAMYWCGYWTAVYHLQGSRGQEQTTDLEREDEEEEQEEEETEMLVSTQR